MPAGPPDPADAPPELRRQFWLIVGLLNAALLAPVLGVLLIVFQSRVELGLALVAVGVVALALGLRRYRAARADPSWGE